MLISSIRNFDRNIARRVADLYDQVGKNADQEAHRLTKFWRDDDELNWPIAATNSKRSVDTISEPTRVGVAHYRFQITAPYAHIIEMGRYPGVGPKTARQIPYTISVPGENVTIPAGIYPTQKPSAPNKRGKAKVLRKMSVETEQKLRPK